MIHLNTFELPKNPLHINEFFTHHKQKGQPVTQVQDQGFISVNTFHTVENNQVWFLRCTVISGTLHAMNA